MFDKENIKAGYLLVVLDTRAKRQFNMTVGHGSRGQLACCCPKEQWFPLERLDNHLIYDRFTVMEIYGYTYNSEILDNSTEDRKCLWTRPAQKMTVAEIEAALGYKIEIISDEEENLPY